MSKQFGPLARKFDDMGRPGRLGTCFDRLAAASVRRAALLWRYRGSAGTKWRAVTAAMINLRLGKDSLRVLRIFGVAGNHEDSGLSK